MANDSGLLDADINSTNEVFLAYKNAGFTLDLVLPALLLNLVAVPGILLNIFLTIVTIKNKNLHGATNILIALISLFECLHQLSYLLFLGVVLSGVDFLPLRTAFYVQLPSIFGFNATAALIMLVAADRLFAVIAPQFRDEMNKLLYLFIHLVLASSYAIWMCYYILLAAQSNPLRPVTGYITETIIFGKLGWSMVLILASCCIYALIGIIVRCKTSQISTSTNSRVLRSVSIIIGVNLIGYLLNISLFHMMIRIVWGENILIWRISILCSFLLLLGAASNSVILYLTSSEYQDAFRKQLSAFGCRTSYQNSNIVPIRRSIPTSSFPASIN